MDHGADWFLRAISVISVLIAGGGLLFTELRRANKQTRDRSIREWVLSEEGRIILYAAIESDVVNTIRKVLNEPRKRP
jgi:hypothetical protein